MEEDYNNNTQTRTDSQDEEENEIVEYLTPELADAKVYDFNKMIVALFRQFPIFNIIEESQRNSFIRLSEIYINLFEASPNTRAILTLFWEQHRQHVSSIFKQPAQLNIVYPLFTFRCTNEVSELTARISEIMKHLIRIGYSLLFSTLHESDIEKSSLYLFDHFIKALERENFPVELLQGLKKSFRPSFSKILDYFVSTFLSKSFILKTTLPPLLARLRESPELAPLLLSQLGKMCFPEHSAQIELGSNMVAPFIAMSLANRQQPEQQGQQLPQQLPQQMEQQMERNPFQMDRSVDQ